MVESSNQNQVEQVSLADLFAQESVVKKFQDILGKNPALFIKNIIAETKVNPDLLKCDPHSIVSCAEIIALLNLPPQSKLSCVYISPQETKKGWFAEFQMGWKGYVQLAIRSGQYNTINAVEVYEGELVSYDKISGEVEIDEKKKRGTKVIGYVAYFSLLNGFQKTMFWTKQQAEEHGVKYSKSYESNNSRWQVNFDAMALKSLIKQLLNKYGFLSSEMQTAIATDQAIIKDAETLDVEYADANEQEQKEKKFSNALQSSSVGEIEIKESEGQKKMNEQSKTAPQLNLEEKNSKNQK